MTQIEMENKIKDLLEQKITAGEMDFLHGFYEIPNLYKYSIRNTLLIMIQGGSCVASFDRWNKMGRHVKKGEKAKIEVLVPIIKNFKDEENESSEKCVGFIGKKVFDISQTDGKPLEYKNNSAEVIACDFNTIAPKLEILGSKIGTTHTGTARGYYNRLTKEIFVSESSNNSDKCKTLFHELGHAILHADGEESHSAREVEAELVSILTAGVLGVEFQESALYVKAYNENKPQVRVLRVISAVQKIIKALSENV